MLGFTENGVMKRFIHLAAALVSLSATSPLGQAKSDTDVYMIKAEKVTFEKDKVTIVGSAKIKMVVIKADHDPSYKGQQIWGRPSTWVHAKADKATFVIHKPKPQIIKNEKLRPKKLRAGSKVTRDGLANNTTGGEGCTGRQAGWPHRFL